MSFATHITPTAVFQSASTPCAGFLADIGNGAVTSPHHATGQAATSCASFLADIGDGAANSPHHTTGRAATSCAGFLADIGNGAATSPHHAIERAAIHLDTRDCYPSRHALYFALTWLYSCDDMVS